MRKRYELFSDTIYDEDEVLLALAEQVSNCSISFFFYLSYR